MFCRHDSKAFLGAIARSTLRKRSAWSCLSLPAEPTRPPALRTSWNGALRAGDPEIAYPCGSRRVPGREPMRVRLPADRLFGLTAPAVGIGNRCHSRTVLASISDTTNPSC